MKKQSVSRRATPLLLAIISLVVSTSSIAQTITTYAGGSIGEGRLASTVAITQNALCVTDTSGDLILLGNQRIRKVNASSGIITTIAGGGSVQDGDYIPLADADVTDVRSIATDNNNNIYLAKGSTIYHIDPLTNQLVRIAGQGVGYDGDNGPALNAKFQNITYIFTDGSLDLYVADNHRIRKITMSTGIVTTIAGGTLLNDGGDNGPASLASFSDIKSAAFSRDGHAFILTSSFRVRKIDGATGIITTVAGTGIAGPSGDGGLATAAKLSSQVQSIAVDFDGNLFISDYSKLRKVDAVTGIINTVAGSAFAESAGDGGPATSATFSLIRAISTFRDGTIYLEDFGSNTIRRIDKTTGIITRWAGSGSGSVSGIGGPKDSAQLHRPEYITTDKFNNLYISDAANRKIYKIDAVTKNITTIAGTGGLAPGGADDGMPAVSARIGSPFGIAVDPASNVYFVDNNQYIRKIDGTTGILTTIAGQGTYSFSGDGGPAVLAEFNTVDDIAVDNAGNILIADIENHRIRKIDIATGNISTIAGTGVAGYSDTDSIAINASLFYPIKITTDKSNNIFFNEAGSYVVRRIDALTGHITTVAGVNTVGLADVYDGPSNTVAIGPLTGLAVDTSGNLYLALASTSVVRRVDAGTGFMTRLTGDYGNSSYSGDNGPAINAKLNNPGELSLDNKGNLFIADVDNSRIRMVNFSVPVIPDENLYGAIFYDLNSDGIKGTGEDYADGVTVSILQNGVEKRTLVRNGRFNMIPDTGYYELKVIDVENYVPFPGFISGYKNIASPADSVTFMLQPGTPSHDLSLNVIPTAPPRIGSNISYRIEYSNSGTLVATGTKIKFIKSTKSVISSSTPAFSNISGDTLTWNLNTLNAAAHGAIQLDLVTAPPPMTSAGDSMYSVAYITQNDPDIKSSDDTVKLRQIIIASYDPNDKSESHGGYISQAQILDGSYLNYTIRFQNTGTDTAFKVVIRDTLPADLDFNSLQMIAASHDYVLSITDGNKLEWQFKNILLPDSNVNEKASHGYISFRVKPLSIVPNGTLIKNQSHIYFDLNPVVNTNTVQTLVRDLPQAPPKPSLNLDTAYCGAVLQQKIKVNNPNALYKTRVIVGTVSVPVGSDSLFTISPKLIPPGNYTVMVQYINESGESWLIAPVKITAAVTPEVSMITSTGTITNVSEVAIVTATNKKAGGTAPLYTFAKDRNFTTIIQAESTTATVTVTADKLSNGDNYIYVRMRTSEACYTAATALDSVKIAKNLLTTSVTDIDNPGVTISSYPNPFASNITIKGLLASKTYNLSIYDARGVVVSVSRITNKTIHTLNTTTLKTGTYWITIRDAKKNTLIGTLKAVRN